jgi:hypothetical protein
MFARLLLLCAMVMLLFGCMGGHGRHKAGSCCSDGTKCSCTVACCQDGKCTDVCKCACCSGKKSAAACECPESCCKDGVCAGNCGCAMSKKS